MQIEIKKKWNTKNTKLNKKYKERLKEFDLWVKKDCSNNEVGVITINTIEEFRKLISILNCIME